MARPRDDELALAEADARALGAVLVPESGEPCVKVLPLGYERRVVTLGKGMENLPTGLGEALISLLISSKRVIDVENGSAAFVIPASLTRLRALSNGIPPRLPG